jgi:hypothetical protein
LGPPFLTKISGSSWPNAGIDFSLKIVLLTSGSTTDFYSSNPGNVGNALFSAFIFFGLELNMSSAGYSFFFSSKTPLAPQSEFDIY